MQQLTTATHHAGPTGLLAIDIGNSNIVLGVELGRGCAARWRMTSEPARSTDELALTPTGADGP